MSIKGKIAAGFVGLSVLFSAHTAVSKEAKTSPPCYTDAKSHVAVDLRDGAKLFGSAEDRIIQPASMAKMMTLLIIFDAVRDGLIDLSDTVYISQKTRDEISKQTNHISGIEKLKLRDAIYLMALSSYNDLALGVAKDIAKLRGSQKLNEQLEDDFIDSMNERAAGLNMSETYFGNSTGLFSPESQTTVKDLARLYKYIHDEQEELHAVLGTTSGQYAKRWVETTNTLAREKKFQDEAYTVSGKTGFINATCRALAVEVEHDIRETDVLVISVGHETTWARHSAVFDLIQEASDLAKLRSHNGPDDSIEIIDWKSSGMQEQKISTVSYSADSNELIEPTL